MESPSIASSGRVINEIDYFRLSQNLESIRMLISQARDLMPERVQSDDVLIECVKGHTYDETLALLAVIEAMQNDDSFSPEVWQLIGGHNCSGKLQKLANYLDQIPPEGAEICDRLERLVCTNFKQLTAAAAANQ